MLILSCLFPYIPRLSPAVLLLSSDSKPIHFKNLYRNVRFIIAKSRNPSSRIINSIKFFGFVSR